MSRYIDEDEEDALETIEKSPKHRHVAERSVKYKITAGDEVWYEYLTHSDVSKYHDKGWTLERVYWWQVWK